MFSSMYANHSADHVGLVCDEVSLTRSEFVDDCDINQIISRFSRTGLFDHVSMASAAFADVSAVGEYSDLAGRLSRAQEAFEALPAKLRDTLDNDPNRFLSWIEKASNEELLKYGLSVPASVPAEPPADPAPSEVSS